MAGSVMAQRPMRRGERGAVLGAAIISALLGSIASYLILQIAVIQSRHAQFHREHVGARHAAEAGLVFAYQRLWSNPAYCATGTPADPDPPVIDGLTVDVTVSPCPGSPQTVSAKVTY